MTKGLIVILVFLFLAFLVFNDSTSNENKTNPPFVPVDKPGKARESLPLLGSFMWPRGEPASWGDTPFNEAFARAREGGIELAIWTYNWGELETKPNHYEWAWLDLLVNQSLQNGLKVSLSFEIAQSHRPPVYPPDIKEARFDDPKFEKRLLKLYENLANRYKGKIDYLWIGQEYDTLLHLQPEHRKPFIVLVKKVQEKVHAIDPDMKFGLVASYHLAKFYGYEKTLLQEMAKVTDLMGFTLYVEDEKNLSNPEETIKYFDEMMALFPKNKIFIHETSWSSGGPKGSPEKQAEYVRQLGKAAQKHKDQLEALCWWVIHDFAKGISKTGAKKYGTDKIDGFMDWHDSVGLIDTQGKPKPGWIAWKETMLEE